MGFYEDSSRHGRWISPRAADPGHRSGLNTNAGGKYALNSGSQRGYNHSWRLCLTPADRSPSLRMPCSWWKHEPELNREEHPLRFSSPHLSTSAVPFLLSSVGMICPGSPLPSDTDLLLYSSRLSTQARGLAFVNPLFSVYISFSSPAVWF